MAFSIDSLRPKITCPHCGTRYPSNQDLCPGCGQPKPEKPEGAGRPAIRFPSRAVGDTSSAVEGTAERLGAIINGRWQLVFALIMSAAVVLAIVVLALSDDAPGVGSSAKPGNFSNNQGTAITISDTYLPTPSPSPEPTPDVVQNPITSIQLVFLNAALGPDVTLNKDGQIGIQLECRYFPQDANVTPTWSSSNENILTVNETGYVQVVGVDPTNGSNATIKVECGGLEASVIIRVPQYQAQHLKENKYNAG